MLNPDGRIWQERFGEPMKCIGTLEPYKAESLFRTLASLLGKTVSYEQPQLDGEYPGGFRFSGALPPIVSAPAFTIRKPASRVFTLDEYVEAGILTERQKDALCMAVSEHQNLLVVGGTGSGKTTLANALIAEMVHQFPDERHVIIEDTREIQCTAPNAVFFHTTDDVSMTKCLKQTLRFRPTASMSAKFVTKPLSTFWMPGTPATPAAFQPSTQTRRSRDSPASVDSFPEAPRLRAASRRLSAKPSRSLFSLKGLRQVAGFGKSSPWTAIRYRNKNTSLVNLLHKNQ